MAREQLDAEQPVGSGTQVTRDQRPAREPRRLVPVALSALLEGLGQAYNRQPVKAIGLAIAGLGLSTASGLNTWLVRKVPGATRVTIGTEQLRPWLIGIWAAIYVLNLWDAWSEASERKQGEAVRIETALPGHQLHS